MLLKKEQEWWDKFKSEGCKMLHGRPTGTGSVSHSLESKKKTSETFRKKRQIQIQIVENKHLSAIEIMSADPKVSRESCKNELKISTTTFNEILEKNSIVWSKNQSPKRKKTIHTYNNSKIKLNYNHTCARCNKLFITSKIKSKYCSYECKVPKLEISKAELIELYTIKEYSSTDIALLYNSTAPTIRTILRKHNISIRNRYSQVTSRTKLKIANG
jgi:hypothetical protein